MLLNSKHIENTPILLLTYKKFDFIQEILCEIFQYSPSKLYIFHNKEKDSSELVQVKKVKEAIFQTPFPFEVEYVCHDSHLVISQSFNVALDYVFSKEEQLIVIEDDIVPNQSFFSFCNEMLYKYKNSKNIGCINGCNLEAVDEPTGFFLSNISVPYWGWATWKSKWKMNRLDNYYWNNYKETILNSIEEPHRLFFEKAFNGNANGLNIWDMQWNLSLLANNLKTIIPTTNLINNKGFVNSGTSTNYSGSSFNNMKTGLLDMEPKLCNSTRLKVSYEQKIIKLFTEITAQEKETLIKNLLSK